MSRVKTYREVGATNNALAYKVIDRKVQAKEKDAVKEAIMNFAVAVLAEVGECAKQEDAPIYEGDNKESLWWYGRLYRPARHIIVAFTAVHVTTN